MVIEAGQRVTLKEGNRSTGLVLSTFGGITVAVYWGTMDRNRVETMENIVDLEPVDD